MTYIELANEELVPRVEKAIAGLMVRQDGFHPRESYFKYIGNKIKGVQNALAAHREEMQKLDSAEEILALATVIESEALPTHMDGAKLVAGYLREYASD